MTDDATGFTPAQLDTLANIAGLNIPAQYRDSVLAHMRVAAIMAEKIYAVPLPGDALELAPVFEPWTLPPDPAADA